MCWRFIEQFPSHPSAPLQARHAVTAHFGAEPELVMSPDTVDDIRLVLSKLAANAVHASTDDFTVSVDLHHDRARVEVTDTSRALPRLRAPSPTAAHGRGLLLVAALAADWRVDVRDVVKTVWATFSLSDSLPARVDCRFREHLATRGSR